MTEIKLNNSSSIWKLTAENDLGLATASVTGNLLREYGYDAYGLPISRTVKYGTNVIQNFGYNFNPATGNLNWRKDNNRNLQESFGYDNLNRLTGFGGTTIAYDKNGNITDDTAIGSYAYENTAKPYAVTTVTPYSAAIPLRNQDVTYNGMQRPATITENGYVATFSYDDGGERVKMLLTHNATTQLTRYYLGGQYEIDAEAGTERLYLGGDAYSASAVYVKEAGNWNIYYICRDYQGSITHIVDANGSLKQELSYDPWGRLRDPNTQQVYAVGAEPVLFLARGYTGHEHLTVFGLINMNARLYDPALGRFLSPDSYVQSPDNSQNFNRYSYCLNNPLRYSDPTGLLTWNDVFGGIALVAGVVLEIVGLPVIGTALIVAGFSHFASTIDQMQNSNMNWNQASNYAGFQFSTTININGPTAKEKNYANSNETFNPSIDKKSDDSFERDLKVNNSKGNNELVNSENNYGGANGLTIYNYSKFDEMRGDKKWGGVLISLSYMSLQSNGSRWMQSWTSDFNAGGIITSGWDDRDTHNGNYYTQEQLQNRTKGNTVSFYDRPASPYSNDFPSTFTKFTLFLVNRYNQVILKLYYGYFTNQNGTTAYPLTVRYHKY